MSVKKMTWHPGVGQHHHHPDLLEASISETQLNYEKCDQRPERNHMQNGQKILFSIFPDF